ncbi:MAG: hypothetical protein AAF518_17150 [Spirochaetota bacterium]
MILLSFWVFTIPCTALPSQEKKNSNSKIATKFRKLLLQSKGRREGWRSILRVARYDGELRRQLRQAGTYPSGSSSGWICGKTNKQKLKLAAAVARGGDYDWAKALFREQLHANRKRLAHGDKDICYALIALKYGPKLYAAGLKSPARKAVEKAASLFSLKKIPRSERKNDYYEVKALSAIALVGVDKEKAGLALMLHMLQDAEHLAKQEKHSQAQEILELWFLAAAKIRSRLMPPLIRKAHVLLPLKSFRRKTRMYAAKAMTNNGLKTGSIKDILTAIQWWGAGRLGIEQYDSLYAIAWEVCAISDSKRLLQTLETKLPQSITEGEPPGVISSQLSLEAVRGCLAKGKKRDAHRLLIRAWNVHHTQVAKMQPRYSITFLYDFTKLSQKTGLNSEIKSQVLIMAERIQASDYYSHRKAELYVLLNKADKIKPFIKQLKSSKNKNLAWTYAAQGYITLGETNAALLAMKQITDVSQKKSFSFSSDENKDITRAIVLNARLGRWQEAQRLLLLVGENKYPALLADLLLISLGIYDSNKLYFL